jgi:hypothetical protein
MTLMSDVQKQEDNRKPVGNLTDFVLGVDKNNPLDVEVSVNEDGNVIVFHNKQFKSPLSWFEYDLETSKLDFVMDNGDIRNAGMPLAQEISKHMQNAHQILTILLDDETGQAKQGTYIPLIVHRS